ncbi:MAG: hypothetical protein IPN89_11175 [Saprospiraceae bacterium]|nr:hypothetical protein [Saprospiraceae bacterium]
MTTIIAEIKKGKGGDEAMTLFSTKDERVLIDKYQQMKAILRLKEPNARLPYLFNFD